MDWVLIFLLTGGFGGLSMTTPIQMASKDSCLVAAAKVDIETLNVRPYCINRTTGETVRP